MPLFCALTRANRGTRIVFYYSNPDPERSTTPPNMPGCRLVPYPSTNPRKWHYDCANAFLDGTITVDDTELTPREEDGIASAGVRNEKPWSDSGSAHVAPRQSVSAPKAEDFRNALRALFEEAERNGLSYIDIQAGDLHRRVGGYPGTNHRMPQCCDVMRAIMTSNDVILSAPPSGRGASLAIRYKLPRTR